jgi:hypothetical protein
MMEERSDDGRHDLSILIVNDELSSFHGGEAIVALGHVISGYLGSTATCNIDIQLGILFHLPPFSLLHPIVSSSA